MNCPVCLNAYSTPASVRDVINGWDYRVDCPVCGRFDLVRKAYDDFLDPQSGIGQKLTPIYRARIAHKLRTATTTGLSGLPKLTSDFLERFIKDGCPGPSPAGQATNAIKYVGDEVGLTGNRIERLPQNFFATIGAPNPTFAREILMELKRRGMVDGVELTNMSVTPELLNVGLTLDGWKSYEDEKKGQVAGVYGFLAVKFGESTLDSLEEDVIKPTIKTSLNFDIIDMRDVARAGVIDNIMREQIRDVAFVIVDLTHDNSGAYWEAGYAEGLGKPVVYICEKEKFDQAQTHFDTNHCTTILWERDDSETFKQQLVATLRRSLNLF